MEKSFRLRLVLALAASSGLALWAGACGSSSNPATVPVDSGLADAGIDTGPADTGPVDTGADNYVKVYDAGTPTTFDGGFPCVVGGVLEEEPNDTPATANVVDPTRCGVILLKAGGDGGAEGGIIDSGLLADSGPEGGLADSGPTGPAESDFLTFTLKPTTHSFYVQYTGDVSLTVTVAIDGGTQTFTISSTSSPTLPYVRDTPYYIEVKSNTGKSVFWRVTVFQET